MQIKAQLCSCFLLSQLLLLQTVSASDMNVEKHWQEEIKMLVDKDEQIELQGQSPIQALYKKDVSGKNLGAIILLHDLGKHPDWQYVIHPLRTKLPQYGWSTLSVQMPVLDFDKRTKDYVPLINESHVRIQAAIDYLQTQNFKYIFVAGHGLGAIMAADFLSTSQNKSIKGLILISITGKKEIDPVLDGAAVLSKITTPKLDIFGSSDDEDVIQSASLRVEAAASGAEAVDNNQVVNISASDNATTTYRQIVIPGANHDYNGAEKTLIKRIRGWMQQQIKR